MGEQGEWLQVSLSNPQNGWIELAISTTEEVFKEAVSYTPNDFILELTAALSLAMQGSDGVAVASCEPVTYEMTFRVTATNMIHLQIVKFLDLKRNRKSACLVMS